MIRRACRRPQSPRPIVCRQSHRRHIHVADLSATAKDSASHDLGVKTFLNGALVSNIVLDTSTTTTDTIDYVPTDTNGLTSTTTRTIFIEAPVPPPNPAAPAFSTAAPSTTQ
jgi:hypothetical protein